MGHYASEMMSDNPEFKKLNKEITKLKNQLEKSPASAFTVGDLPKIQKLLEHHWSAMHVSDYMLERMKAEIKALRAYLAKVPK